MINLKVNTFFLLINKVDTFIHILGFNQQRYSTYQVVLEDKYISPHETILKFWCSDKNIEDLHGSLQGKNAIWALVSSKRTRYVNRVGSPFTRGKKEPNKEYTIAATVMTQKNCWILLAIFNELFEESFSERNMTFLKE